MKAALIVARTPRLVALAVATALGVTVAAGATNAGPPPLIGMTFTHRAITGCDLGRTGIVQHYDTAGVRRLVRSQLAAMHAAGLETIRILL